MEKEDEINFYNIFYENMGYYEESIEEAKEYCKINSFEFVEFDEYLNKKFLDYINSVLYKGFSGSHEIEFKNVIQRIYNYALYDYQDGTRVRGFSIGEYKPCSVKKLKFDRGDRFFMLNGKGFDWIFAGKDLNSVQNNLIYSLCGAKSLDEYKFKCSEVSVSDKLDWEEVFLKKITI